MVRKWFAIPLWQRVVGALILGVILGLIWGPEAETIKWIGDFFIASIKMLVVPLIFFSLISGVTAIGDLRKLGAVGGRALLIFLVTSQFAVWLGLGLGTLFMPGVGLDQSRIEMGEIPEPKTEGWREMILSIVPQSPVQVMADANVLPLIVFALLIGIGILMAKEEGQPLTKIFDAGSVVMQKITILVMELTPFGVFALMAWVAGTFGVGALLALAKLVALNYAGCFILIGVVYVGLLKFFAKVPVGDFFRGMIDAIAVAYSTASSSATLPVTLRCLQRNIGVSPSVSSFTASLGATINMDGTAMYLGLATLFGAQIFGVQLDFADYVMVAVTATLGSVGAAGIPGTGLIMMTLVFSSVGVPLETIAFVAGVDRIMDMMRTVTNVTSDATCATTVAAQVGELDRAELVSADDV
ncbi:dicarboxylate/amino acid:cation symporter [Croceicoccus naphthovorans]|uniref:Glutamate:proton symporter n=1 Tax=Croceicoccus naphthovorans TaxID=1348774 RepID=A0A0G3XEF8_9SPHN|nr:dicarboxylate/amino acid:cation symporter [Croceicoccus naphthovorans]AKM09004.1 glutamate:proton symporter [Croceicoccus naphthovorans]MBB3989179.1 Na+/H+-dicarboxylate symporter [Croceicoccus naphthovorans]